MIVKNTIINSILAGVSIGIACTTYLMTDNKYIAAFMFSLGLFVIIIFKFDLYTGKTGNIPYESFRYIFKLLLILVGNLIGTFAVSAIVGFTKLRTEIQSRAADIVTYKTSDTAASILILSMLCGILIYIAVEGAKKSESGTEKLFSIVIPVMSFIMCGYHHSIADSFYIFTAGISCDRILYVGIVALGNAIGSIVISVLIKNLSDADVV